MKNINKLRDFRVGGKKYTAQISTLYCMFIATKLLQKQDPGNYRIYRGSAIRAYHFGTRNMAAKKEEED